MKATLRKITVEDIEYLYCLQTAYCSPSSTKNYSPIVINKLTVRIFLTNHKTTPLVIEFITMDDFIMGQPLNVGVTLPNSKSNTEVRVNLHEPKYIRELVLLGLKNGWTGINKLPVQNGLQYLTELGFDVNSLMPR